MAHEVRNPLAVIFNPLASLQKQKPVSPDAATLLDIVQEESSRPKRVVSDLLEFARPHELSVDTVAPARLVASASAAAQGEKVGDQVIIEADDDLPDITCDEHLVRQALINLVTNALQAPGRTEPVHVRASVEGSPPSAMCFSVSDDGAGVSAEAGMSRASRSSSRSRLTSRQPRRRHSIGRHALTFGHWGHRNVAT